MKIKELQAHLQINRIDCALLYSLGMEPDPNFHYFTNYAGVGCLVIPKKGQPLLLAPQMEYERAKKGNIKNVKAFNNKKFFESIYENISSKKDVIGIDKVHMNLRAFISFKKQFKKSKVRDVSGICLQLRTTKNSKEVRNLVISCAHADNILQKCIASFQSFKTESDVAAFLRNETFKRGLDISFPPIIASGSNGSMPHYMPQQIKLKSGLCVIDFGVKYNGYCSDITRTVAINTATRKEKKLYGSLLEVQEAVINEVGANKKCSDLYEFVVRSLKKDARFFTHGLGHGIGVEIHELPNLTANSPDKVQDSITFTIEPGLYFPKRFGIRIEDSLLFQKKPILLTKTPKELVTVRSQR